MCLVAVNWPDTLKELTALPQTLQLDLKEERSGEGKKGKGEEGNGKDIHTSKRLKCVDG